MENGEWNHLKILTAGLLVRARQSDQSVDNRAILEAARHGEFVH